MPDPETLPPVAQSEEQATTVGARQVPRPPKWVGPALAFSVILGVGIFIWLYWGQSQIAIALASVANVVGVLMAIYQVAKADRDLERRTQDLVAEIKSSGQLLSGQLQELKGLQGAAQLAGEGMRIAIDGINEAVALARQIQEGNRQSPVSITETDLVLAVLYDLADDEMQAGGVPVSSIKTGLRLLRLNPAATQVLDGADANCGDLLRAMKKAGQVVSPTHGTWALASTYVGAAQEAYETSCLPSKGSSPC